MAAGSTMILNGRIEKTDIPTLLRSVEKDKNSGELSFNRSGERIELYFLFGQLYHAKWDDVIGVEAVAQVLTWRNGNYSFTEGIIPAQASINEDIERILANSPATRAAEALPERRSTALPPIPAPANPANRVANRGGWNDSPYAQPAPPPPPPSPPPPSPPQSAQPDYGMADLVPFDLASLDTMNEVFPNDPITSNPSQSQGYKQAMAHLESQEIAGSESVLGNRVAPSPPAAGLYRTRLFCLPTGEQMATSLVATGPQLEEELLHLSEVKFTGYVLGGPDINGFPAVGICLLRGRFIHAFYHYTGQNGLGLLEGEKAYRTTLDQRGNSAARFYWFYELPTETMRAAISLLTPPTRYAHLEVRIVRFKELLRLLNEEGHTGSIRITIPSGALGHDRQLSSLQGEKAYIPVYQGNILGLWSENHPRLTNDGQLLQRFLNEPQAFLDLHSTTTVSDPGLPLEALIAAATSAVGEMADVSNSAFERNGTGGLNQAALAKIGYTEPSIPAPALTELPVAAIDDDERQMRLITSIGRMESTWTQMQKKGRIDSQTMLLALAGFGNEVLSITESVTGRRALLDMIQRGFRQELAQYRTIFQLLDLGQGRISIGKLLREYELFSRDGTESAEDFAREASRGMRTLLRSTFQFYVSLIRSESVRFESHDMYEVFLQDVVKKM